MSGWVIGGVWTSPGAVTGFTVAPVFQRDVLSGPLAGLPHSYGCGGSSSGVLVLKFQR